MDDCKSLFTFLVLFIYRFVFSYYSFFSSSCSFWATIFNRLQNKAVNLLLPIDFFVYSTENRLGASSSSSSNVIILNEFASRHWINAHNVMHFLKSDDPKYVSYITADDCDTGFLHLYHYKISLDRVDLSEAQPHALRSTNSRRTQLTDGAWCVDCDENVNVDEEHALVYFSAFKDPLECHLYI